MSTQSTADVSTGAATNGAEEHSVDAAKDIPEDELEDAANHASEIQDVVMDAADRHGDDHLYLAARSLRQLNEKLSELAYE